MRILYFTHGDSPHDQRFLKAIINMGHEVAAMRLQHIYGGPQPIKGVQEYALDSDHEDLTLSKVMTLLPPVKRILKDFQPDVVHAGPIQGPAFLVALAGAQPLLSMSWGYDLLRDAEFDISSRWVTHYTLNRSNMLLADCQSVVDKAVSFGFSPENAVVFPWGVDLVHFSKTHAYQKAANLREALGWQDQFILLGLRSWEGMYGVDVLARAFVKSAAKNSHLRLLLLGQGSQELIIKSILDKGGVTERVHFGGRVSLKDLPAYYGAADLYVSTSHVDGSSVSLLEAMACETPVLVSDIPGNREWVQVNETGMLFPDGDSDALASALMVCEKAGASVMMTQQARKLVEAKADWQKNVQLLDQAYHRLAGR